MLIHVRSAGAFVSREAIAPFEEANANAGATGAALRMVHMNGSAGEWPRPGRPRSYLGRKCAGST